jgi:hypothetical protein
MNKTSSWALTGLTCLAASIVAAGSASAQTSDFDSLTCVNVSTDRRFADNPEMLTLTPEEEQLMESRGCRVIGGTRIARADALCYPTEVDGGGDGGDGGADLSGQVFLCYDVRCQRDEMNLGNVRTELSVTDRFGDGTIFVNERPTTKRLCVPAAIDSAGPTATPRPSATPNGSPTPIQTPGGSPTPGGGTPTPGATPTPGSASLAFVDPVASLLH